MFCLYLVKRGRGLLTVSVEPLKTEAGVKSAETSDMTVVNISVRRQIRAISRRFGVLNRACCKHSQMCRLLAEGSGKEMRDGGRGGLSDSRHITRRLASGSIFFCCMSRSLMELCMIFDTFGKFHN